MVILRLGSSTDKMIEAGGPKGPKVYLFNQGWRWFRAGSLIPSLFIPFVACDQVFKQQYHNGPDAFKLRVFDARKDAQQLQCIVSSSSVASYGSSVLKMSQAKAIHCARWNFTVDDALPNWDGANQWHAVGAKLYTYFMEGLDEPLQKASRSFSALIAPIPFGRGAMRYAFYVMDQENPDRKYVGKVYQFNDDAFQQKSTYEGDMGSQAVASYLAKEFNVRYPESPIEFVQAHLLDLGGATDAFPFRFMALEPWIAGKYEKYTSNAGHVAKDSDLAQAYSHFTWHQTAGEIMVVDIQGVENTLTDPQIHSLDTDRFGRGNLSCKGMDAFFMSHVCNEICHTLNLPPHPLQPGVASSETLRHLGSIVEDEVPNHEGPELKVDWMPMFGSKLCAFMDAVRKDAEDLASHATSESEDGCCLGGAVLQWKDGPEIVEVKKGSPAEEAGCEPGVMLKLVGGKPVKHKAKQEVLQLLAAENNMIVAGATVEKIRGILERRKSKEEKLGEFGALMALKELESLLGSGLHGLQLGGSSPLGDLGRLLKALEGDAFEKELEKHFFLEALQADAAKRAKTPDAADGWDEQLAVPCDALAGATFAWTCPPRVTCVLPGSPADGLLLEGNLGCFFW